MKLHKQIETLFHLGTAAGLSDGRLVGQFVATRAGLVPKRRPPSRPLSTAMGRWSWRVPASVRQCRRRRGCGAGHVSRPRQWRARSADASLSQAGCTASRFGSQPRPARPMTVAGHASAASETTMAQSQNEGPVDHELYKPLHDELARLPESFRSALVLCYLEGLTQEQAAAALRCPLGTIQSRLARGRAKLKSRLVRADSSSRPSSRAPGPSFRFDRRSR